jgi:hypothetical protein
MSAKREKVPSNMDSKAKPLTIELTQILSVEYLYNFLRFNAFLSISDDDKKALFLEAYQTPLKRADVFPQVVAAVKADDFPALQRCVRENKIDQTKETEMAPEVWPLILDCYFQEKGSAEALMLLQYLIGFPILDKTMTALKQFIKLYTAADAGKRMSMVGDYVSAPSI